MTRLAPRRVAPFGHLGITVCVRLPRAFRSLPRPSSPSCAQASPTRLRSLDHILLVKQSTRDLLRAATGTWRLGVSCASTSELFASPARPMACRRSRNCVTCVDSSICHADDALAPPNDDSNRMPRGLSHDHYFHPLSNSTCEHHERPRARLTNGAHQGDRENRD
jgi:hypothetical protein